MTPSLQRWFRSPPRHTKAVGGACRIRTLDTFAGVETLQNTPKFTATFAAQRTAEAYRSYWARPAVRAWLLKQLGVRPVASFCRNQMISRRW